MLKHLLTISLICLLASAGAATADTASGVTQLAPALQKAVKKGGYCTGLTLKNLGCNPQLPKATSVIQVYEQGWRVVSDVIDSYGYHFLVIEEQ